MFIKTESEFVGEAVMVFTPVANKKSVVTCQFAPPSVVLQKPPLLEPAYNLFVFVGSTKISSILPKPAE